MTRSALMREMPPETYGFLNKGLGNGFRIERAWCQTPCHDVQGVLTQVRSRLLDFILELKENIGDTRDEQSIKQKVGAADSAAMFRQALFGNVGDYATIILGSHNTLAITNAVNVGDLVSLTQALTKAGFPDEEVESLRDAIADDENSGGVALSNGKTGGWLLRVMERAAKGGLKIGADVATHVATTALNKYLGGG